MLVIRNKKFSGYEAPGGFNYAPAQVGTKILDNVDYVSGELEKVPVVNKASKKWRNRIGHYTKSTKILIKRNDSSKK